MLFCAAAQGLPYRPASVVHRFNATARRRRRGAGSPIRLFCPPRLATGPLPARPDFAVGARRALPARTLARSFGRGGTAAPSTVCRIPAVDRQKVEPMTRDLLHYLATQLVDFPDDVKVDEEITADGKVLRLSVRREDVGKVIGKQGRTARALRNLVHAAALVRQERVNVQFVDA